MKAYFLGNGHHVYDTGHYYTSSGRGRDIGFTKENQQAFFNAINECNDKEIKEYLKQSMGLYSNGKITRGGRLVKFDINGTHNGESPLIKLANKYNSLKPEDEEKAITILESLLLAHKLVKNGINLDHKKIIEEDINNALDISEKHEDKKFHMDLRGFLQTHYGPVLKNYDVMKLRKQGSESGKGLTTPKVKPDSSNVGPKSGNDSDDWVDITPWLSEEEFKEYELKEEEKLAREERKLAREQKKVTGLRLRMVPKSRFVEGPAKADKSNIRRTGLKPETSPAQTSASSAATKVDKAPQQR